MRQNRLLNKVFANKILLGLAIVTMTVTGSIETAQAAEGDIWLTPVSHDVASDTSFDMEVHIDTGGKDLGTFNVYLDFDQTKVTIDGIQTATDTYTDVNGSINLANDAIQGFDRGSNTQSYMMLSNVGDTTNGHFHLGGVVAQNNANGSNEHIATVHFKTKNTFTAGTTVINVRVNELSDELGHAITMGVITGSTIAHVAEEMQRVSIYRLYNKKTGTQLYARGEADKNKILSKWSDFEFTDGSPAFYASITDDGSTPIYRLYNRRSGAQLYTRGEADKNKILSKWSDFEFTDGGPAFYASLTPQTGLTPIFRLYNTRTGMQLYTRGEADKNKILSKWSDFEFTDGGPAFYMEVI